MRTLAASILIALVFAAPAAVADGGDETLRNEDVVMMLVGGEKPSRVIEVIRASVTAFDLSEEMTTELGLAGVPPAVLRAMRERQAAIDGPEPPPVDPLDQVPAPLSPPARGGFRVTLEDADSPHDGQAGASGLVVALPGRVPDPVATALQLPADDGSRTIARAAIAVLCVEPRHVPDHWRSESPLGRDFLLSPRHTMIAFEVGRSSVTDRTTGGGGGGVLEVAFPAVVEGPLEGPDHRIVVGLAIEIGDRWYLIRSIDLGAPEESGAISRVDATIRVRSARVPTLEQELERAETDRSHDPPGR